MRLLLIFAATAVGLSAAETYLSVSVNGGASRVAGGSPILIMASAAGDTGSTKEFDLKLTDATGESIAATERPELAQTFSLDEMETTQRVWVLDPKASAVLRPGRYTTRVSQGELRSPEREFAVDLATAPDPLVRSQGEQLEGRSDRALEILDAALAKEPAAKALLLRKSEVLAARGEYLAAVRAMDEVIEIGERETGSGDGDQMTEVKALRSGLIRRLLTPARR